MLGEALRLIRVYSDMSQKDMAHALDVSQSYLSEIEKGKKEASLSLVKRYSDHLKVPMSSLLFFSEQIEKDTRSERARIAVAQRVLRFLSYWGQDKEDEKRSTKAGS